MAIAVLLSGSPGTGKTRSLKQADERYPGEIVLIDVDSKPIAWAGGRKQFNKEKKNYFAVDTYADISKILIGVSEKMPQVKCVVVDTVNTMMSNKEMRDRKKPGYDKWSDLSAEVYDLFDLVPKLREDLIVVFAAHTEAYEADGMTHYRLKTVGQKLTKLNMNGKISYNLYTKVKREGNKNVYSFITQTDGRTEARSVEGVLPFEMPNDLGEVIHLIRTLDLCLEK